MLTPGMPVLYLGDHGTKQPLTSRYVGSDSLKEDRVSECPGGPSSSRYSALVPFLTWNIFLHGSHIVILNVLSHSLGIFFNLNHNYLIHNLN